MPLFMRQLTAILWKDLKTEARTKERFSAMCFFSILMLLVFNFAFRPGSEEIRSAAPGIFWATVTFAGLLGLNRSFILERENDALLGLLLTPSDRATIYLGKAAANFLTMVAVEVIILPLFAVFLNVPIWDNLLRLLPSLFVGTLGFTAVGTLFSAMSIHTRMREVFLPMLTLPILVPVLLAAVETFGAALDGEPLSGVSHWFKLGASFSIIFLVASLLLFDHVVEE